MPDVRFDYIRLVWHSTLKVLIKYKVVKCFQNEISKKLGQIRHARYIPGSRETHSVSNNSTLYIIIYT